jgi:hypothetical protein
MIDIQLISALCSEEFELKFFVGFDDSFRMRRKLLEEKAY